MPFRKQIISTGNFYHVYSHAVGDEEIFKLKRECQRALALINYYRYKSSLSYSKYKLMNDVDQWRFMESKLNSERLVDIFAFCLMPNHYHFLLRQNTEKGISSFISNFQNGYAKYFNLKFSRQGSLFCQMFKAKLVENDKKFIHISRYIHLNLVTGYIITTSELETDPRSSYSIYMDDNIRSIVSKSLILNMFKTKEKYKQFVLDQADYQKRLAKIKSLVIEKYPGFKANQPRGLTKFKS